MFLSLVRNYSGVGLSKLGEVYRQGGTYPVYMEICYTRRTLNNMFKSLQNSLTGLIWGYFDIQKQSITSLLWNALYIIPILVFLLALELRRLRRECGAVVKSFKILPK